MTAISLAQTVTTLAVSDSLGALPGVVTAVMFIVTVAAGAYAALNREQMKTLRDNNKDLTDRVVILEADRTQLREQVTGLQHENVAIAKVVTGEAHLVAIDDMVREHHKAAEDWWESTAATLDPIPSTLQAMLVALQRLNQERPTL